MTWETFTRTKPFLNPLMESVTMTSQPQSTPSPELQALLERFANWQATRRFLIAAGQPANTGMCPLADGAVHINQ